MPKDKPSERLSRRERQVMNILFRRGRATVAEVMDDLPDPPTYSAVRSILRILGGKGLITHREDGPRYVYVPAGEHRTGRATRPCGTSCARSSTGRRSRR